MIPRPHLSFEAQLVAGRSHDFGPITCPEQPNPSAVTSGISYGRQKHEAELKYPQRIRWLNIFPASKAEIIRHLQFNPFLHSFRCPYLKIVGSLTRICFVYSAC